MGTQIIAGGIIRRRCFLFSNLVLSKAQKRKLYWERERERVQALFYRSKRSSLTRSLAEAFHLEISRDACFFTILITQIEIFRRDVAEKNYTQNFCVQLRWLLREESDKHLLGQRERQIWNLGRRHAASFRRPPYTRRSSSSCYILAHRTSAKVASIHPTFYCCKSSLWRPEFLWRAAFYAIFRLPQKEFALLLMTFAVIGI